MPSAWNSASRVALQSLPELQQTIPKIHREKHAVDLRSIHGDCRPSDFMTARAQAAALPPISTSQSFGHHHARPSDGQHPGWNSRSGLNTTWAFQDSSQMQHTPGSFGAPPGLIRAPTQTSSYSPMTTPDYFGPRTPQDHSLLPMPIGRPQNGSFDAGIPVSAVAAVAQQPPSEPKRRTSGKDEFDGPHQFLPKPDDAHIEYSDSDLISLKVSLYAHEQDDILAQVNDCLSKCAFDFVAKYQFPIPIEADKRPVRVPSDREWTEWCHLLKRLATKRRIPMRVLWNNQIKQLVTVLENSLEMRHAAKHQSRPLKDDRNVLQLISAGLQVAKMLKDPEAMVFLDALYTNTELTIRSRAMLG